MNALPTSLALGERPLRVIVCPNDVHPRAVEAAAALYRRVGCQVLPVGLALTVTP